MPIPFHDVDDIDELGTAGFLKFERLARSGNASTDAAIGLLVINARGEPLEFAFNRLALDHAYLWGDRLALTFLQRRLVKSVLSVCSQNPRLLVCLASELGGGVIGQNLRIDVPFVRIEDVHEASHRVDSVTGEVLESLPPTFAVTWQPAPPDDASPEWRLVARLQAAGLLLEPFQRASLGLREVYLTPVPERP